MKKIYSKFLMTGLLAIFLSACGTDNKNTSGNNTSIGGGSNGGNSVIPTEEEFKIVIQSSAGVTVAADKSKAKAGETVTLTTTISPGYSLTSLRMNNTPLIGISGVYTFIMPDQDVVIKTSITVDGKITIAGDVPALLEDEGEGIFVARNVAVANKANVYYVVEDLAGNKTELSVVNIDRYKTFADISLPSGAGAKGFTLAGNAKYDFYYDASLERPCYIQRVEVTKAPETLDEFQSLFAGSVQADSSTFPLNVNSVKYQNTLSRDKYEWTLFDDNSSLAVVKDVFNNKNKAYVYKALQDLESPQPVYMVVDNYVEGNFDETKKNDTSAFSGKYHLVEETIPGYRNYQRTYRDAEFDMKHYSHDTNSIDFDMHWGYRTGFDSAYNDYLKAGNRVLTSETHQDGSFTVTIASYKVIDSSTESDGVKLYYKYDMSTTFNKAGAILSGDYSEVRFGSDAYDFNKLEFKPGGQGLGVTYKETNYEYGYGDPVPNTSAFDPSPYFASSIKVLLNEEEIVDNKANINQTKDLATISRVVVSPDTALDLWSFGAVRSTNPAIIGPKNDSYPHNYIGLKLGTATVTYGNHSTNDVTTDIEYTVINDKLNWSYAMVSADGWSDNDIEAWNKAYVSSGYTKIVGVTPSPSDGPSEYTPVSSNTNLLTVSVNAQNQMVLDATSEAAKALTALTLVQVTIKSDYYEIGHAETVFSIYIRPVVLTASNLIGTWLPVGSENASITFSSTADTVAGRKTGLLIVKGVSYEFAYTFTESNMQIKCYPKGSYLTLIVEFDISTKTLGVAMTYEDLSGSGADIIGWVGDGEEWEDNLIPFTKTLN